MFYGAGAGLMYSYVMIIPIFPKRTGLLYGVLGLPIALAMLFYVAFVNMGDYYKWIFVVWMAFIPFSVANTFLNMPKSKLDFGDVRLGWETRKDGFLGNKKAKKINHEFDVSDQESVQKSVQKTVSPPNDYQLLRSRANTAVSQVENLRSELVSTNSLSFKTYLKELTSIPIL